MKKFDHKIVCLFFEKNANFFAENCQKSQKILTITSTPGVESLNSHSIRGYHDRQEKDNIKKQCRGLP
jgi:hypothetical protein